VRHDIRMIGEVRTRSAFIRSDVIGRGDGRCRVVGISPLLRSLLVEAVDLPLAYEADARAQHIMALILHEMSALKELPLCVPFPADPRLTRCCQRFLAAPSAHATIDTWAASVHMSRRAFTRHFRHETGLSLSAWRQQACVVAALPRLMAGEPVTSVALDLGYATPAAFAEMFRRIMGASPREYVSPMAD
jgi:AraC-like DNA-binding protein